MGRILYPYFYPRVKFCTNTHTREYPHRQVGPCLEHENFSLFLRFPYENKLILVKFSYDSYKILAF